MIDTKKITDSDLQHQIENKTQEYNKIVSILEKIEKLLMSERNELTVLLEEYHRRNNKQ